MRKFVRASLAVLCLLVLAFLGMQFINRPVKSPEPGVEKNWRTVDVVTGLRFPWSIAWLPDGRAVITGLQGALYVVKNGKKSEVKLIRLPPLYASGQGGLMDIAPHPKFAQNRLLYMTMSTGTDQNNRTILVRGKLEGNSVRDFKTLFRVKDGKSGNAHFGSRLLWLSDGTLLMSVGDGGNPPQQVAGKLAREQAQNLGTHHGKILRLTAEGQPAPNNPFLRRDDALPEIWTYGHRNVQGLALNSKTGEVWATEHGPRGGDELNLIEGGKNYGWPIVTYGHDYVTNLPIGVKSKAGMIDPVTYWTPSRGVCGLTYYSGDKVPAWTGSLFSAGLASADIRRTEVNTENSFVQETAFNLGPRIRDVRQGPDGYLYALTDEFNGRLVRLERN